MSEETDCITAEEHFVADIQYAVQKLLNQQKISRRELAQRLYVSEEDLSAYVFERPHLSARWIARIFHVLGKRIRLEIEDR